MCAVCTLMKAGVCMNSITPAVTKVPTLHQFYSPILLRCLFLKNSANVWRRLRRLAFSQISISALCCTAVPSFFFFFTSSIPRLSPSPLSISRLSTLIQVVFSSQSFPSHCDIALKGAMRRHGKNNFPPSTL